MNTGTRTWTKKLGRPSTTRRCSTWRITAGTSTVAASCSSTATVPWRRADDPGVVGTTNAVLLGAQKFWVESFRVCSKTSTYRRVRTGLSRSVATPKELKKKSRRAALERRTAHKRTEPGMFSFLRCVFFYVCANLTN
uniref:(northern house mosquito) hypothetical protein n=1 Tax=Culex pipiens TaxID=7175 RepID=A0A8D8MJ15_CULPI